MWAKLRLLLNQHKCTFFDRDKVLPEGRVHKNTAVPHLRVLESMSFSCSFYSGSQCRQKLWSYFWTLAIVICCHSVSLPLPLLLLLCASVVVDPALCWTNLSLLVSVSLSLKVVHISKAFPFYHSHYSAQNYGISIGFKCGCHLFSD